MNDGPAIVERADLFAIEGVSLVAGDHLSPAAERAAQELAATLRANY
jgi:hypothetical protein